MKVCVLGPGGTFSHEAALLHDRDAEIIFENTIYDVFDALDKGKADVSVVPLENATSGVVGETLDSLLSFSLKIRKVIFLRIVHNLVGTKKENIKRLFVHPQTHEQCRNYIRKNFRGAEIIYTSSNSASAKLAEGKNDGAIVPTLAAELYGRNILERGVEDNGSNATQFAVLDKEYGKRTGNDRTYIVLGCVDRPGILYEILGVFAKRKINLSKIDSRPNKKKMGEYIFYLEFSGHPEDREIAEVMKELRGCVAFLSVLGGYPVGDVV